MISKRKRLLVNMLQLPLTLTGIVIKYAIAIIAFTYFRWVRQGIYLGSKLNTYIETHELGIIRGKK